MISCLEEVYKIEEIISKIKKDFDYRKIAYNKNLKIGMMIETPAIILNFNDFVDKFDFFTVGTNDLIQYIMAVDREHKELSSYYSYYNKAVLNALKIIVEKSKNVSVCGEMASDENGALLLLALGYRNLSLNIRDFLIIKKLILNTDISKLKIDEILNCKNEDEIKKYLSKGKSTK